MYACMDACICRCVCSRVYHEHASMVIADMHVCRYILHVSVVRAPRNMQCIIRSHIVRVSPTDSNVTILYTRYSHVGMF